MSKLTLKIDGMGCEMCVKKVTEALTRDGVTDLDVKIGKATMKYDETKVSEETLIAAVVDAGFTAKAKKGLF